MWLSFIYIELVYIYIYIYIYMYIYIYGELQIWLSSIHIYTWGILFKIYIKIQNIPLSYFFNLFR
jgi:hypothetical protein